MQNVATADETARRLEPNTVPADSTDQILGELRETVATIWRRKSLILIVTLCSLALGLALILNVQPLYRSAAQILFDPRGLHIAANEVLPRAWGSDIQDIVIDTNLRLMTATPVLERVVRMLQLEDDPEFVPSARARMSDGDLADEARPGPSRDERVAIAAVRLREAVRVRREARTYIVTAEVTTKDAEKSAAIAKALIDTFVIELETRRRSIIARAREAIAANFDSQRAQVEVAERAVEEYRQRLGIIDEDGRALNTDRLRELNRQVLGARQRVQELRSQISQIESLRNAPQAASIRDTIESPTLTQLRTSLTTIQRQRDNVLTTLGPLHPAVKEIETQVASTVEAITRESTRTIAVLKREYDEAVRNEASAEEDLASVERSTVRANASLVGLRELERDAEASRSVFNAYLERERELREQEAIAAESVTLVTAARPPTESVGVRPLLVLLATTALGIFAGVAAALGRERLDGRVHSANALALRTGVPIVGILPLRESLRKARKRVEGIAIPSAGDRGTRSSRVIHLAAESLGSGRENGQSRVLLIGLGTPQLLESVGLAFTLAHIGDVLLLDAQMCPGLEATLTKMVGDERRLTEVAFDDYPGLTVHLAPIQNARDALRLQASIGHRSLSALSARFRFTVALAGPQTQETTLRLLAEEADDILLVVETGITSFKDIEETGLSLGRHAGKLVGALVADRGRDPVAALVPLPPTANKIAV